MSVRTSFVDALREILGADHLLVGDRAEAYGLGAMCPEAAVLPRDESEVSRVLRVAWEEELGVVPWGGGMHQSIGFPPTRYDLALDLRRLNQVVEYEPADMTATAQSGIRMPDLQRHLGTCGQFLPLDPAWGERASLGGIMAANLSGPLRCRYGTARDLALGMRVAHADGTITKAGSKVVKNASAYDMPKLYVGSLGTLGVILEVTFRAYPRPGAERGWWLQAPKLELAQALAVRVLGSQIVPNRVELLEARAARTCGYAGQGPVLLVSCAGVPEALQAQAADLARIAEESGGIPTEVAVPERTWAALSNFPWRDVECEEGGLRAIWRASVLPADCARGMQAVRESVSGMTQAGMAASVAHGILRGSFHSASPQAISQSLEAAREALVALGGFLVVLEAPAVVLQTTDVWGPPPDALAVMRRLKGAFDDRGILNPGRFVAGI